MVEWFSLEALNKGAARFDFAKLENLNGHYLRTMADSEIVAQLKALVPVLPDGDAIAARIGESGWAKLEQAMPGLKERAKTLVELLDSADYLFVTRPLSARQLEQHGNAGGQSQTGISRRRIQTGLDRFSRALITPA